MNRKSNQAHPSFRTMIVAAAVAITLYASPAAQAENGGIVLQLKLCTAINCGATAIQGRFNPNGTQSNPWVGQYWASASQPFCLRLQVTNQNKDTEMSVVAPYGAVFTSDNGGGSCSTCPRVVISPAFSNGIYTAVVNNANGAAAEGGFFLSGAIYPTANPNCASPTVGLSPMTAAERIKMRKAGLR